MSRRKRSHINARPKGKVPRSTPKERLEYARKEWERDPSISIMGTDGMHSRCKEIFGVSPTYEQLQAVRAAVAKKQREARIAKEKELERANKQSVLTPEQAAALTGQHLQVVPDDEDTEQGTVAGKTVTFPKVSLSALPPDLRQLIEEGRGRTLSEDDAAIRHMYAAYLFEHFPKTTQAQMRAAVQHRFGMGIANDRSADARALAEQQAMERIASDYFDGVPGSIGMSKKSHVNELRKRFIGSGLRMGHDRAKAKAEKFVEREASRRRGQHRIEPSPQPLPKKDEVTVQAKPISSQDNVRVALQMIREEIPDLARLELVVPREGSPVVRIERHAEMTFNLDEG